MFHLFPTFGNNMPNVRVRRTIIDKTLEAIAVLLLLTMWVLVVVLYDKLPDIIPTHFNISGEADNWSGKSSLLIMAGVGTLAMIGTAYRSFFPAHMSRFPVMITDENKISQFTLAVRYLRVLNILLGSLFIVIICSMSEVLLPVKDGLFNVLSLIIIILLLLSVLIYNILARRYR